MVKIFKMWKKFNNPKIYTPRKNITFANEEKQGKQAKSLAEDQTNNLLTDCKPVRLLDR
jgi:hypothetical protein